MSWIEHPKFRSARDTVLASIRRNEYSFRKVSPIAFLCGGADSPRRNLVRQFLQKSRPDLLLFYADDVWQRIADTTGDDALGMERELASLSDVVLVIVESPGTFTELGAFALYPPLRRKLLPILNRRYASDNSFINSGPVRSINNKSDFRPVIWADFDVILTCSSELLDRLKPLSIRKSERVPSLTKSDKHLLLFVCDLIAVFGPCSLEDLTFYLERTVGVIDRDRLARLVALANEMKLVHPVSINGAHHYARPLRDGEHPSFQETEYLSLPNQRATILSAMLKIPEGVEAIEEVARNP